VSNHLQRYNNFLNCQVFSFNILSLEERTKESKVFKGNFNSQFRNKTAVIFSLHAPSPEYSGYAILAQNAAIAAEDFQAFPN